MAKAYRDYDGDDEKENEVLLESEGEDMDIY